MINRKLPVWVWYAWPLVIVGIIFLVQWSNGSSVSSSAGEKLYAIHCKTCHGPSGEGLGRLVPPLAEADYVLEGGSELACDIRYGLRDSIVVNGVAYGRPMPAFPDLPAVEVRSILTYIRTAWGNDAPAFSFDEVRKALADCDSTNQSVL